MTVDEMEDEIYGLRCVIGSLRVENARLRGLVVDMMRFFEDGDYCMVCEATRECTANEQYNDDCLMRGVFHDRMHELGIEVDA